NARVHLSFMDTAAERRRMNSLPRREANKNPDEAVSNSRSQQLSPNKCSKVKVATVPAALIVLLAAAPSLHAQQPRQYTDADYAAAEKFMPYNVNPLAYSGV